MQTKHLCVLIHIWTKGEVGAPLRWFKLFSKIFLLTVPRRCFFYGSFMLFLSCFVMHVCLLMTCGHLLWKGWPLRSRLWCLIVTLSLTHWYSVSGVVLDCIDSWSFPSFLLCCTLLYVHFSFAIILMGKTELFALLGVSSWCLMLVVWLFLSVPWVCLLFVIVYILIILTFYF